MVSLQPVSEFRSETGIFYSVVSQKQILKYLLTNIKICVIIIASDVLFFRKNVTITDVLEETYHFWQNLNGMNDDVAEPLHTILNEIDAKEYLLRIASDYSIPRRETESTRKHLERYKKQLAEIRKG